MSKIRVLSLALAVALFAGCGGASDGLARVALKGTLTRGGVPVKAATMNLIPEATNAPSAAAYVTDGKFAFTSAAGPVPGKYKVEVEFVGESKATVDDTPAKGG
ncbi:MAG TPA: hypothetical protein VNC50_15900, partial [Planctomycetia bacterium]|nr:hypothetical protein [Planctomycetia bacterium]